MVNIKRKVNVIEDIDGKKTVFIHDIIFKGKRSVNWDDVEKYLKQYVGDIYTIDDSNDAYSEEICNRIRELLRYQIRKYSYLIKK